MRYQRFTYTNESDDDCQVFRVIPKTKRLTIVKTIKANIYILIHNKFKMCFPNTHYYWLRDKWHKSPIDTHFFIGGKFPTVVTSRKRAPVHWTNVLDEMYDDGLSIRPWPICEI